MSNNDKQMLRQLAVDAKELAIIKRYTKGIEAQKKFIAVMTPATVLALLDELEAAEKRIAELESRTVTLPLPRRKIATDYVEDVFEPCDLAAVYNACRLECEMKFKNALADAGVKVAAAGKGE